MDYEKKYRELIEKIELISHSALTVEQHQIIDTILGEIKESEDEKIRKELITWLQNTEGQVLPIDRYNAALAWLEKQGDKDKLIQELGKYKAKYTQDVLEKHINSMSNKDDERLRKTTIAFLKDFAEQGYENAVECIDWLEKQGEQKVNYTTLVETGNGGINTLVTREVSNNDYEEKPADKVEPKKIKLQPSQWNISDFRTWQYIVSDVLTKHDGIGQYLDNGFCKKIAQDMQNEWSKKLCSIQHTAWSEEDENILEDIKEAVINTWGGDTQDIILDWLKSLKDKYTWKPSDEQMEALEWATKITGSKYKSCINSLYSDLKKLREE